MDSQLLEELDLIVEATFPNVRSLHAALLAIKSATKHVCALSFGADGLGVKWEHESKALQSGIFLGAGMFSSYNVTRAVKVGIPFHTLLETLAVFTSSNLAEELVIRYPGPNAELLLEAVDDLHPVNGNADGAAGAASTYARLDTIEIPEMRDMLEYWEAPESYFIENAGLLREAVEDLEWTRGDVEVRMQRDPPTLELHSSKDALALEIAVPPAALSTFSCAVPHVRHSYNAKLLRTAFANVPPPARGEPTGVSTKAKFDAHGLLQVTHMLSLGPGSNDGMVPQPLPSADGTQHTAAAVQRMGVAQFVLQPLGGEDDGEDDGASAGGGVLSGIF